MARESSLPEVARLTAVERPDVALVIVADGTSHALALIDLVVHEAACPVIAMLDVQDPEFINEAAGIDERAAFDMLRTHARSTQRKVVDVAGAVAAGHRLLPARANAQGTKHGGPEP